MPCRQLLRRCVVSRTVQPQAKMLRFIVSSDKHVIYDEKSVLPGRGIWVSCSRKLLSQAVQKNIFSRVVRQKVYVVPHLVEMIEQSLEQQCLGLLGLAYRARQLILGNGDICRFLASGHVCSKIPAKVLVYPKDTNYNVQTHLLEYAIVTCFSSTQLMQAVGHLQSIDVLMIYGKLAQYFFNRALCLALIKQTSSSHEPYTE